MRNKTIQFLSLIGLIIFSNASIQAQKNTKQQPLMIAGQGSFAVGGTVIKSPGTFNPQKPTAEGQTFRGDHAYIFYQIPVKSRKYPLVM